MFYSITVVPDERGESADYEAYSMVGKLATGEIVWVEGIRKDRSTMYPEIRATVEAQMAALQAEGSK